MVFKNTVSSSVRKPERNKQW